jgi:hypothetical protein
VDGKTEIQRNEVQTPVLPKNKTKQNKKREMK